MRDKYFYTAYDIENEYGIVPYFFEYIMSDSEFIILCKKVLKTALDIDVETISIHSDTDNEVKLFLDKSAVNQFFKGNPTKHQCLYTSYYVLRFIFNYIFGEDNVYRCYTSYKSSNRYNINIKVINRLGYKDKMLFEGIEDDVMSDYIKTNRQLSVLENKKKQIIDIKAMDKKNKE